MGDGGKAACETHSSRCNMAAFHPSRQFNRSFSTTMSKLLCLSHAHPHGGRISSHWLAALSHRGVTSFRHAHVNDESHPQVQQGSSARPHGPTRMAQPALIEFRSRCDYFHIATLPPRPRQLSSVKQTVLRT